MLRDSLRWKLLAIIFAVGVIFAFMLGTKIMSPTIDNTEVTESPTPTCSQEPIAVVVLDPGHGGFDKGASGASGVAESELNLDVALKTRSFLEQANVKVILTRETESAIADTKKDDMQLRRQIMHESNADLTVSIHMNMFSDTSIHGAMVFYTKGDEPSQLLAERILAGIDDATGEARRAVNTGDYYVIRNSSIPAVIAECGFLSNPTDEANLCSSTYRETLAHGIFSGIMQYIHDFILCDSSTTE